jgi:membrane protein DedA with SNARE-associated domain
VACFLGIGYYMGEGWERMAQRFNFGVLAVVAVAVIAGFAVWFMKRRRY